MPTYDYKCGKCDHRWEGTAKMNDPCPPCPTCEGESHKVFSKVPPAHFHGGGWAADNYSSSKQPLTVNQMMDRGSK